MSTKPIDVKELARRFKRGNRWATARMREMRHLSAGGDLFTTEEWLLEWLVAESVPQTNWPKQNMDPLEEAVCSRVIQMMGELAMMLGAAAYPMLDVDVRAVPDDTFGVAAAVAAGPSGAPRSPPGTACARWQWFGASPA